MSQHDREELHKSSQEEAQGQGVAPGARQEQPAQAPEGNAQAPVAGPPFSSVDPYQGPDVEAYGNDELAAVNQYLCENVPNDNGKYDNHAWFHGGREKLQGAVGRVGNIWNYAHHERPEFAENPDLHLLYAAANLGHGIFTAHAFENGNKRLAYWVVDHFLDNHDLHGMTHTHPNGEIDDPEYADHLVGYDGGHVAPEDTYQMLKRRYDQNRLGTPTERFTSSVCLACLGGPCPRHAGGGEPWIPHQANILDPIHSALDPSVWDAAEQPEPILKPEHRKYIYDLVHSILDGAGYDGMENWMSLALTGSLTTYQYSDESDCDVSLFVNSEAFPEWSRAEMIGLMVQHCDGETLPGTPHPMQVFVVDTKRFGKEDLYKPGLRSAYDLETDQWIVPPEKHRVLDVEREMNEAYTIALESADKMDRLLRYEPDKAVMYWHQIHKRRMRDQQAGKGDYSPSNIVYKMLNNRGLFPQIEEVSGEHIA
jgi:hypothetical protein